MEANVKYNIKIVVIWVCFCLIATALGLFLADAIDVRESGWRAALGIVSYLALIVGTIRYGKYVRSAAVKEYNGEQSKSTK